MAAKKKTAKKAVATKGPAKKAAAKKAPAKKAVAKKAIAKKKAVAKKAIAKKKAPAKKAVAKKAKPARLDAPVRGAALVEMVIAHLERTGAKKALGAPPEGLSEEAIAGLTLPGGLPLPPSLRRWLAYDARWLGWFEDLAHPVLPARSYHAMMVQEFDEQMAEIWDFSDMLPETCLVVPGGCDSRRFLYAGKADDAGEYPVLLVDTDDIPFICVEYPGFDVYLATSFDVIETHGEETYAGLFADPLWAPAMEQQARLNLLGFKCFDHGGGDTMHVDGDEAAEEAMQAMNAAFESGDEG
jgi:hypothetical protein